MVYDKTDVSVVTPTGNGTYRFHMARHRAMWYFLNQSRNASGEFSPPLPTPFS
jgi:hypothetical protein